MAAICGRVFGVGALARFTSERPPTLARAERWAKLELELPLRAVFSTDLSSIDHRGFVFAPELAYQHENLLQTGTQLKLSIGAKFADEELQDYFYEVDDRFATSTRPAFDADFGYLGSRLQLLASRPFGRRFTAFAGGINPWRIQLRTSREVTFRMRLSCSIV